MSTFKQLNSFILKKHKTLYFISAIATVFSVLFSLLIPLFNTYFIDTILGGSETPQAGFIESLIKNIGTTDYLRDNLIISSSIIIIIALINCLFTYIGERASAVAAENSIKQLKDRVYDHLQKLPYEYLNKAPTGDLVQRCTSDIETIRRFLFSKAMEIWRIFCLMVVSITIMLNVNSTLTLATVVIIPVIFIFGAKFANKIKNSLTLVDEKEGELTTVIQENLTGVRVVRAFGREKFEVNKFESTNREYKNLVYKFLKLLGEFWATSDILCFLQIAIVLIVSVNLAFQGKITIGEVLLFNTYEQMFIWPVRNLGKLLSDFSRMQVSLDRVFEILNTAPEKETEGAIDVDLNGDIVFSNVDFSYSDGTYALKNISFTVKKGQTVAILGSTGSGKSTLMHLLLRLYDYTKGSIKINGTELRNIKKKCLRSNIGIVLQEPFLFSNTIENNIKMAKYDALKEEVIASAKKASIHDVIEDFDNGYDTVIGEKGVTLSGGQKQRLAIARSIIRNSQILIFDDSLSAVDTETDKKIRDGLKTVGNNATVFLISQRITTLMESDIILVMENGEITNIGNHKELIERDGLYKRIWEIQSMLSDDFDKEAI